ncbi:MAG: isocitrate lyase/phosphoenolpyruvate mutase family protein, partial [Rhodospirillaceae bacterium]
EGRLSSTAEVVDKIRAGVEAAGPDGPTILARCDALAKDLSFDDALDRTVAYAEAGAEIVFLSGATPEQNEIVADTTGKPVFTVGSQRTPADVLIAHKVKISAFAVEPYALNAARQALIDLRDHGAPGHSVEGLPRDISLQLQDADHWTQLSAKFNAQSY